MIRTIIEEVDGGWIVSFYDKTLPVGVETGKRVFSDLKELINFIDLYLNSNIEAQTGGIQP